MNLEVERAVEGLRASYPGAEVVAADDGDGGAIVTIDPIDLGPTYVQGDTWIKFTISYQYPFADVYPLFVRPDLARVDGQPHGEGITDGKFEGEPALQLSRRSNSWDPEIDSAALKVAKVIDWMKSL